jgi:hypothetical protein
VHEPGSALTAWESFYVIVGSSGGALIGLQFVVITLIADRRALATFGALSAFGTPTVVHFTYALAVSAIMSAPWPSLGPLSVVLGISGVTGLVYGAIVIRRARRQTDYKPVGEDWFWYAGLPCFVYAVLTITAAMLRTYPQPALFAVAASAITLLLIGIHNAWDTVTHIVMTSAHSQNEKAD